MNTFSGREVNDLYKLIKTLNGSIKGLTTAITGGNGGTSSSTNTTAIQYSSNGQVTGYKLKIYDSNTQSFTDIYLNNDGNVVPNVPAGTPSIDTNIETIKALDKIAVNDGTGYIAGDLITHYRLINTDPIVNQVLELFYNETTNMLLADNSILADSKIYNPNIDNRIYYNKFGRNTTITTASVPEDIWEGGGVYTGQPLNFTPSEVNIVSDSANDNPLGTGLGVIRIIGLKSPTSIEYESEDVNLNGITQVQSVNTWWRINRAYGISGGAAEMNEGTITITSSVGGHVFASLPPNYSQTQICAYTVPFNKTIYITGIRISIARTSGSPAAVTVLFMFREPGGVWRTKPYEVTNASPVNVSNINNLSFIAGTDVKFRVEDVSDNTITAEAEFDFYLE